MPATLGAGPPAARQPYIQRAACSTSLPPTWTTCLTTPKISAGSGRKSVLPIRRAAMSARREAMRETNMKKAISMSKLLLVVMLALASLFAATAHAAAPGITGTGGAGTFNLTARTAYLTQPDGQSIYSWGYGCTTSAATFAPAAIAAPSGGCAAMQVPGPTLIVTEGQPFSVTLTNNLPT